MKTMAAAALALALAGSAAQAGDFGAPAAFGTIASTSGDGASSSADFQNRRQGGGVAARGTLGSTDFGVWRTNFGQAGQ